MNEKIKQQITKLQDKMVQNNNTIDALTSQNVSIKNKIDELWNSIYKTVYFCKKGIKEHDHKNKIYSEYCGQVKYVEKES